MSTRGADALDQGVRVSDPPRGAQHDRLGEVDECARQGRGAAGGRDVPVRAGEITPRTREIAGACPRYRPGQHELEVRDRDVAGSHPLEDLKRFLGTFRQHQARGEAGVAGRDVPVAEDFERSERLLVVAPGLVAAAPYQREVAEHLQHVGGHPGQVMFREPLGKRVARQLRAGQLSTAAALCKFTRRWSTTSSRKL